MALYKYASYDYFIIIIIIIIIIITILWLCNDYFVFLVRATVNRCLWDWLMKLWIRFSMLGKPSSLRVSQNISQVAT